MTHSQNWRARREAFVEYGVTFPLAMETYHYGPIRRTLVRMTNFMNRVQKLGRYEEAE